LIQATSDIFSAMLELEMHPRDSDQLSDDAGIVDEQGGIRELTS
jgi:hypothetical protein